MKTMKICVLKGGVSEEREVSLRSGSAVAGALKDLGHEVSEVDVDCTEFSGFEGADAVFIALHGTYGEDGGVQRYLASKGVAFTGCGEDASRKAFDKEITKELFVRAGVPTPRYQVLRSPAPCTLPLPVVVKPAKQGSSVGVSRVHTAGDWEAAVAEALRHDDCAIAETMVVGRELTVGILGDRTLPVVEIRPVGGFYDFAHKYTAGGSEYFCPAELSDSVTAAVQEAALAAHRALGCEVYSRVDVLIDGEGKPSVLEVNTIPGMTATSLLPKAAKAEGMEFGPLCERIVELSVAARGGATR